MTAARKAAGAAAAVLWIVFGITAVILWMAGDGKLLASDMARFAPPEESGLPAAEYAGVGDMTARYLTGAAERFQYEYTDEDGRKVTCFHDYEEAHMADCRGLIRLDKTVMWVSLGAALILTGLGRFAGGRRDAFFRGMLIGMRLIGAVLAALLVWALADFDGLFVTFHKTAFTNDGWLLNPRTDLLIRLMPQEFFISLGIRGAMRALAAPIALEIAARIGIHRAGSREDR